MITMNNLKGSGAKFFGAGSGSSGPVSWNDLTDKPFGEITAEEIRWSVDNLETRYTVEVVGQPYYHMSDKTPSYEQLKNGVTAFMSDGKEEESFQMSSDYVRDMDGVVALGQAVIIVPSDNFTVEAMGGTFEKKGIYAMVIGDGEYANKIASGLLIPGYLKTIDEKFLPDWVLALKSAT